MEPVKRKLYIVIAVLLAAVLIIAAGSMAYDAVRKYGWAKQTASQMVLQDPGLSGNWSKNPYNMGYGGEGTIDSDGNLFWRNTTSGNDAVILLNIYGYDSLSRANDKYSEILEEYGLGHFVRNLDFGKNASLWERDEVYLLVDHNGQLTDISGDYSDQRRVNFTSFCSVVFLKANYMTTVRVGYNDNTTMNADNVVQLAREQAARIY